MHVLEVNINVQAQSVVASSREDIPMPGEGDPPSPPKRGNGKTNVPAQQEVRGERPNAKGKHNVEPRPKGEHKAIPEGNTAQAKRDGEAAPKEQAGTTTPASRRVKWQDDTTAKEQAHTSNVENSAQLGTHLNRTPTLKRTTDGADEPYEPIKREGEQSVTALVSNIRELQTGMLQKDVAIGTAVATAHLNTCATHCFLSHRASKIAIAQGYPAYHSKVRYRVEQGNPLCVATQVHVLPLTMIRNDGTAAFWEAVLFIIADCGADIIVGYPTLRLGGIIDYDPPHCYEDVLSAIARGTPPPSYTEQAAQAVLAQGREHDYTVPDDNTSEIRQAEQMFSTVLKTSIKRPNTETPSYEGRQSHQNKLKPSTKNRDGHPKAAVTQGGKLSQIPAQAKKNQGITALTEAEPYGKNPPLPTEVMEALTLLKNLAEDTTPAYTAAQLDEVQRKLGSRRPNWGNCLTQQHLNEVSDKDTEQFLNDLMDQPRWQKSIFQTAMHLSTVTDFKEFEILQKPGRDEWNPPQPRLYKNPITRNIVTDWLEVLLTNNKCRKSRATHPAPVTVVQRPPRDPRVCLDYRNRNHRSDIPIYPMPDVHDFLEEAAGYEHYCSFDMAQMFTQFRIKESDKHLAAFITHQGVYEPEVVMFGLAGAPQHAVREVGGGMADDPRTNGTTYTEWAKEENAKGVKPPYGICPITRVVKGSRLRPFIDDVFIKSNHTKGMIKMIELFFEFCFDHNLILKRKKANLMKKKLRTLGFVVSREGKHLDPYRLIALLEAPTPRSKETLHSMLSSYTFIRMFIPNFALIAAPLYEATKGIIWKGKFSGKAQGIREVDPDFVWTDEMKRAFDQLRAALIEAPILVTPDWKFPLFLSVDASLRGEGWVLWQIIVTSDGTKVAVAILYGSRKYTDTERKWETTRQEATAIRSALQDVEEYVFGQHFYLFSDHLNLRFMHNSINRAVLRMRDYLAQFNMTVVHCPGAWNSVADAVSRLEISELPVALASNLNSAPAAELYDSGILVSQGTDTSDTCTEESWTVIHVAKKWEESSDEQTKVLRSLADSNEPTRDGLNCDDPSCLLCQIRLLGDDDIDHEDTVEPCNDAHVLHTHSDELPGYQEIWSDADHRDILLHNMNSMGYNVKLEDWENLRTASEEWNKQPTYYPSEMNEKLENDAQDIADLEWCGAVDRSAYALLNRGNYISPERRSARVQISATPPSLSFISNKNDTADKNAGVPLTNGDALPAQEQEIVIPAEQEAASSDATTTLPTEGEATISTTPRWIGCQTPRTTQTTPADFRVAAITIPMKEDFKAIHNDIAGHHGLDFSYRKLLKRCGSKWANERGEATKIKNALKEYIDGCPTCQKLRGLREKIKCKHSFIISRPFLELSYDFIVFTRADKHGNRYILAAVDNFSKIVEMKAVKTRDAETVAQFLLEIASRYGHCARLRSDNEASFVGLIITRLNANRGTETAPCIPYRPEANSVIERQNAIIMFHLTALVHGCNLGPQTKVGWSELIPKVFSIINNTPKNPLGISPLSMVYGVFANYDRPLLDPSANSTGSTSNPVDYFDTLIEYQTKLLNLAEDIQSNHFAQLEKRFNGSNRKREFNEGDFVLQLKNSTGISGKLSSRWIGPFLVLERRDNDPTHPVLDLMNLTDMTNKQAAADDCRIFNTSWFEEESMIPELRKLAAQDLDEYVVEKILDHKPHGNTRKQPLSKYHFLVKWEDFDEPTWEPYSGVMNLEPLDTYSAQHPELSIPISSNL
jgi:hypothetical protein